MANMLDKLRELVGPQESVDDSEQRRRLAMAVLLVEVARADFADDDREQQVVLHHLQDNCGLSKTEAGELLREAEQRATSDISLHRHIEALNRLQPEEKRGIMQALWRVAYADGELHAYEEALLRRLADLLHVGQEDFIRTKHAVAGQS